MKNKHLWLGLWLTLILMGFWGCSVGDEKVLLTETDLLEDFGKAPDYYNGKEIFHDSVSLESMYLPMSDGIRIAIDLYLPEKPSASEKIPTILVMTRYWRATEGMGIHPAAVKWCRYGYAVVMVDARGTGASFGTRPYELFDGEIRDYGEVVDWIISRPWSNGRVGAIGVSYLGSTAELLTVTGHPAVKVVVPKFNEFDVYTDIVYPGGIFLKSFIGLWGEMVADMDMLRIEEGKVRPVNADERLLEQAILDHRPNGNVYEQAVANPGKGHDAAIPYDSISPLGLKNYIEASGIPMSNWGSWLDAATADGVLKRFKTFSNKQISVIGAWSHGAGHHASPFLPTGEPVNPSREKQFFQDLKLMDFYLKDLPALVSESPVIYYYTMGEEAWHLTKTWPPVGHQNEAWYFGDNNKLSREKPLTEGESDGYKVDFDHGTGTSNRWYTQLGGGDVVYQDRVTEEKAVLRYVSEPLEKSMEITGHPVANVSLSTSADEGVVIVYLEAIDTEGKVIYLTEGHLNFSHRKLSVDRPWDLDIPYHTFRTEDMLEVVPREKMDLIFALLPVSVKIPAGYRLSIAIAGQDKDTFMAYGRDQNPELSVFRQASAASFVELPVIHPKNE